MAVQPGLHMTYKMPRIAVRDYSGPAGFQGQPASSSAFDIYRFALERFAAVSASSVTVPSMVGTMSFGAAMPGADLAYSGVALQDITNGKIATMKVERFAFSANMHQAGKTEQFTGEIANLTSHDFDAAAAAAIFDPQKANDDRYYRAYGQTTAGAYTITSAQGLRMRIEGMTIDDVGLRPSRLQLPALMATIPPPGTVPTPTQTRDILEKVARIYEGVHIGIAEMRGLTVETPQAPLKLAAMRFNLENGKIGEFAIEGLDARSPKGPVKVGRFALKSLDVANFLRMSALFSNPAQKPSPDQALGLLALLEGAEVKGLVAPYKDTGKPVNIDTFSLNWGQFVGPIPSKARLIAKISAPLDATDPGLKMLAAAGMGTAAADVEFGGLLKAYARVALTNVPRQVFSINPPQATSAAAQIEAGTIELIVRDTGGVDLAVAQYARMQNVSRDAARQAIVASIRDNSATATATNPDAAAIVNALMRFIESPLTTLTLKLTPRGKVPAMQLFQALKTDPLAALAQFQVEASTAL